MYLARLGLYKNFTNEIGLQYDDLTFPKKPKAMQSNNPFQKLNDLLTKPDGTKFWFILTLTTIFIYGLLGWEQGLGEYVVQDDARQHVFWMRRFLDETLFPNDLIADYFQSVAPLGYQFVYWLPSQFGIDPLDLHKILPIFIHLITAGFCFGVCLELLPIPFAAFSSAILLSQSIGLTSHTIISGTPRAFVYVLFLAFVYFLLKKRLLASLVTIALQGLFYPQIVLVSTVTLFLRLFYFKKGKLKIIQNPETRLFSFCGIGVAIVVMLPFALATNEFDPVITAEQARQLPEFFPDGRSEFFNPNDPGKFWSVGRSGLNIATGLTPETNSLSLLLPLLIQFPNQFPLTKKINQNVLILLQVIGASIILFTTAHLFLFKIHLPSRYTQYTFEMVFSLGAALAITLLIDGSIQLTQKSFWKGLFKWIIPSIIIIILGVPLLFYPVYNSVRYPDGFPTTAYTRAKQPELYQFLQQESKDTLVASLSGEADYIPTFAKRSVLFGFEYAIPYHWGYYKQIRQRILDLIRAQYSEQSELVTNFIKNYDIDLWLIDKNAFVAEYLTDDWLQSYQPTRQAQLKLQQGATPLMEELIKQKQCQRFANEDLVVLSTSCLLSKLERLSSNN